MTNTEKQELRELCRAGYTFEQIRRELDCSDATIKRYLKVLSPTDKVKESGKKRLKSCIDSIIKATARGYIAELEWQEKMSKQYDQILCDRCGTWHIWKRKAK